MILSEISITISAEAVAWYGAIVATTGAIVAGYNIWRDRTNLRVSAKANIKIADSFDNYSADKTYILIEVANTGRRPIHLRTLPYFRIKSEKTSGYVVKGQWRPKDNLNEGESAWMLCFQQDGFNLNTIRDIVVKDALDRKWHGKLVIPETGVFDGKEKSDKESC
jgi:hypothetical protein